MWLWIQTLARHFTLVWRTGARLSHHSLTWMEGNCRDSMERYESATTVITLLVTYLISKIPSQEIEMSKTTAV
jgi:hypothetical protein